MPAVTRQQCLESFTYNPVPKQDFVVAGKPAQWVTGAPKQWGEETNSFQIEDIPKGERAYRWLRSELSPDYNLVAISSKKRGVRIYDVATHELRASLEGVEGGTFRPFIADSDETDNDDTRGGHPQYTLLTSASSEIKNGSAPASMLVCWDLDKNGRLLDAEEEIDADALATKAIDSIVPDLEGKHEWTREFIDSSLLHSEFSRILAEIAAIHRRRGNTTINDARLSSFNSNSFTSDGKKLVYTTSRSTSSNEESKSRHNIVVYDMEADKPIHTHSDHKDNIMWTGFSPDDQYVASVAWDGKLHMYSAITGAHIYTVGDTDQQAWTASFSPDSRFIVWSSQRGRLIQVHSVADGTLVSTFPSDSVNFRDWCRDISWHPSSTKILLSVDQRVFIWQPFDPKSTGDSSSGMGGQNGKVLQTYEMHGDNTRFFGITSARYLDEGRKVAVCSSDGTSLVWDERTNSKELFRRPDRLEVGWVGHNLYFLGETDGDAEDTFMTMDGDGKGRYWNVGFPGLGDAEQEVDDVEGMGREEEEIDDGGSLEDLIGDEVQNVVVSELRKPRGQKSEEMRDTWAERGAELWTAE